jgi:hypothetical protein
VRRLALALVLAACGGKPTRNTPPVAEPAQPAPSETAPAAPSKATPAAPSEAAPSAAVAVKLDAALKAYDRLDLERARTLGLEVLAADPLNVRALRMLTYPKQATHHYLGLPDRDRDQMRQRCDRYGISLE